MHDAYELFSTSVSRNPPGTASQPTASTPSAAPRALGALRPEQHSPTLTSAVHRSLTDHPASSVGQREVCFKACVDLLPGTAEAALALPFDTDAVSVLPFERRDDCPLERLTARFFTFLVDSASFDRRAFNISALEARWTDPQQRLLLESAAGALASCAHSLGA
jgi:hypothetical protein